MATTPPKTKSSESSSKSNWYEVEESEQIEFYLNNSNGDKFYITDTHKGRLRPSGKQYKAVYVSRRTGSRLTIEFESLEKEKGLGLLEEFSIEEMADEHLN